MHGWIVDADTDAMVVHHRDELRARWGSVATGEERSKEVPTLAVALRGELDERTCRQLVDVAADESASLLVEFIEPAQLPQPNARRHVAEIGLASCEEDIHPALVILVDSVKPHQRGRSQDARIVSDQRATFDGCHVLVRMEAETGDVTEASHLAAVVG